MKLIKYIIVLGIFFPNTFFSQKNSISIHSGVAHCFFDKTPIIDSYFFDKANNANYGLFYNSIGISFEHRVKVNSSISLSYDYYNEIYKSIFRTFQTNAVFQRNTNTLKLGYHRFHPLGSHVSLKYGVGINYRLGQESVVVGYHQFGDLNAYEINLESRFQSDLGLSLTGGIEYQPTRWLKLFTNFNILGITYIHDKEAIQRLQDVYNYKKYPSRFDLSCQIGIGFCF